MDKCLHSNVQQDDEIDKEMQPNVFSNSHNKVPQCSTELGCKNCMGPEAQLNRVQLDNEIDKEKPSNGV